VQVWGEKSTLFRKVDVEWEMIHKSKNFRLKCDVQLVNCS
jgi:hypothetical protein